MKAYKSCAECRRKKIKCNQEKPSCSNCSKKGFLCQYQEQKWAIDSADQKYPPKNININKFDEEEIDFYTSTFESPVSFCEGPLTWVSFAKRDRFLCIMLLSHRIKNIHREERSGQISHVEFIKKWNKGFDEIVADNIDPFKEGDLLKHLEIFLSNSKLIWLSIERFFDSEHYLLLPDIDKDDFIEKLVKLIGFPNYDEVPVVLNISKTIDLAYIGILLLIMRFISLSIYNFNKEIDFNEETSFISKNPTPAEVYTLISRIYHEVSVVKAPSFEIFQFVFLKFCFELYSPEEYDCLTIANCTKLGELIQYGIQCSLNRDPDSNHSTIAPLKTEKAKNLNRRLWYMVVFIDLLKFANSGYPLLIDETVYDTKLPVVDPNMCKFDYVMNHWTKERLYFLDKLKPVLKLILNIKQTPTVGRLKEELIPLVDYTKGLSSLDSIMKRPCGSLLERCENHKKLMVLAQSNSLLFSLYYHLFIFYCERQAVKESLYYLIELIKITKVLYKPLLFIDPNVSEYNLYKQLGSATLAFPNLEIGLHKIASLFLSLLCRIKSLKIQKGKEIKNDILEVLDSMVDIINSALSYQLTQFITCSEVYYHSWILAKVQVSIAFQILKIPKGPFLYSNLTTGDLNFKKSLSKTIDTTKKKRGDLGFENYSADDLNNILQELKGLSDVYNHKSRSSNEPLIRRINQNNVTEIDKKWFKRMLLELGQGHRTITPTTTPSSRIGINDNTEDITDNIFQSNLTDIPNDLTLADLNNLINGSEIDKFLNFEVESFFGYGH